MSFGKIVGTASLLIALNGCGGGNGKAPVDTTPKLGQKDISTQEYSNPNTIPTMDFCKNSTKVVLNLDGLPSYYSLQDNNTTLKIDLSNVDVPDSNRERKIPVTCINGNNEVDGNITSTEVDIANDVDYVIKSTNLPTLITEGGDYNATIKGTDSDGVPTISYEVTDGNDNNSTLTTGYMTCNADTNNTNNSTCTSSISGLAVNNNLNFSYNIEPVKVGEHQQDDINGTQNFEVETPASWNTTDLDQEIEDNKNGDRNNLPRFDDSDEKTIIENISDFLNNSNDPIELLQDGIDDGNGGKIYPIEIENGSVVLKADGMEGLADQEYTFTLKSGNAEYTKTIYLNNN